MISGRRDGWSIGGWGELLDEPVVEVGFGEDDDVVTGSESGALLDGDELGVADHDADPDVADAVGEVPDGGAVGGGASVFSSKSKKSLPKELTLEQSQKLTR